MKYIILFALTTLTSICEGQTNEFFGIWIGTADYRFENITGEIYDNFESLLPFKEEREIDSVAWKVQQQTDSIKRANWIPKPVPAKIDTNYYPVNVLLEV